MYPKEESVRVIRDLRKGEQIQREDIEILTIGMFGLKDLTLVSLDDVVGRYARVDIVEGDILFQSKISQLPLEGNLPKDILPFDQSAILIRIKMIDGSEYEMPETGDIVKLSRFDKRLIDVPELQFIRVLSVVPEDADFTEVTIAANEKQMKYIRKHQEEVFYASVIVRSNEELAEKLLQEQKAYFREG